MKKYIEFVNEAILPSVYKEWCKKIDLKSDYQEKVKKFFQSTKCVDHDKNWYRIYFDLKIDPEKWKDPTKGFGIIIPQELEDYFGWNCIRIVDYSAGICKDKDGREIRIGKLLNRMGQDRLLKVYNDSKTNTLKDLKDLQIVISRHPYDVLGESTGRGWTTCHDIYDSRYGGEHLKYLKRNLEDGALVSYLIRKSDKNIENPISRITLHNNYRYFGQSAIYGTYVSEYVLFINGFIKSLNVYFRG